MYTVKYENWNLVCFLPTDFAWSIPSPSFIYSVYLHESQVTLLTAIILTAMEHWYKLKSNVYCSKSLVPLESWVFFKLKFNLELHGWKICIRPAGIFKSRHWSLQGCPLEYGIVWFWFIDKASLNFSIIHIIISYDTILTQYWSCFHW